MPVVLLALLGSLFFLARAISCLFLFVLLSFACPSRVSFVLDLLIDLIMLFPVPGPSYRSVCAPLPNIAHTILSPTRINTAPSKTSVCQRLLARAHVEVEGLVQGPEPVGRHVLVRDRREREFRVGHL